MAHVSSADLAAPAEAARAGLSARLLDWLVARWAAFRVAAERRRALDEVMAISCPAERAQILAEYDVAATRHNP